MKEKLTKNDSIIAQKVREDLHRVQVNEVQNVSEFKNYVDLKELHEQFEAILENNDVLLKYFVWWYSSHRNIGTDRIYSDWKKWTETTYPEYWISQAFLFEDTDVSFKIWTLCDNMWKLWISKNLKK